MDRILIIEDDPAIARIERDYLELSGFSVTLREDGESGLREALRGECDIILLDVMLPGMDGFTVCSRLRETLDIPILLVTARTEDMDKIRGLGFGADDYIEKPFSPSVLVARVRANLAQYRRLKQGSREDGVLRSGSLTLDPRSRRVFLDGREVALTNKEYELLCLMLDNQGLVLTRQVLMDRVWGFEAERENRTLDVHIRTLRVKLGEAGSYIETVRGIGYKIGGEDL